MFVFSGRGSFVFICRYAFVDFVSQTEADLCIKEMNLTEFQSRNLQVRLGSRKSEDEKEGTCFMILLLLHEPRYEKTRVLPMRKQRRRSAVQ